MSLSEEKIDYLKNIVEYLSSSKLVECICLLPYFSKEGKSIIEITTVINNEKNIGEDIINNDYEELYKIIDELREIYYDFFSFEFEYSKNYTSLMSLRSEVIAIKSLVSSYILFDRFGYYSELREMMVMNGEVPFTNVVPISNGFMLEKSYVLFRN